MQADRFFLSHMAYFTANDAKTKGAFVYENEKAWEKLRRRRADSDANTFHFVDRYNQEKYTGECKVLAAALELTNEDEMRDFLIITRVNLEGYGPTLYQYDKPFPDMDALIRPICVALGIPLHDDAADARAAEIAKQEIAQLKPHELLATKHFVEYAEIAHVLMVDTWIDAQYVPIQNSGNNFPIHVYDDLLRDAVTDAIQLVHASRRNPCGSRRCGSLRRYSPNTNVSVLIHSIV